MSMFFQALKSNSRIACLLPSATDICIELGLADNIVGVTHECNINAVRAAASSNNDEPIRVLTRDGLCNVTEQQDIHKAVSEHQKQTSCTLSKEEETNLPESLYPIIPSEFSKAAPTVVVTQDLCSVCAPSTKDIKKIIKGNDDNDSDDNEQVNLKILSLKPTSLDEVAESFVTVAATCGVADRGRDLRDSFLRDLHELQGAIEANRDKEKPLPSLLLLEWLDPPFDGGHWIPTMMQYAVTRPALPKVVEKSHPISWTSIQEADPDILVVACCGFDLKRNVRDARKAHSELSTLSAFNRSTIFAADGNTYFACPGPNLVGGTAILARCAYQDQPAVLRAIDNLSLSSPSVLRSDSGWQRVSFQQDNDLNDLEDCVMPTDFSALHESACLAGDLTYVDPESGHTVFTELSHMKRGYCCGSGCRHCPFNHENVKDKSSRIQQPALLHTGESDVFSVTKHDRLKVLFFSGGKDSFLTIRALVRQYKQSPFGLVLLTTFDVQSRVIAHQNVHINDVLRQAQHLDITLLGIPMHRASKEAYIDRIRRGLSVIQSQFDSKVSSLVFGDLHLSHIKSWRDQELGKLGLALEYPLWQVSYEELMKDLEASAVTFELSSVTNDQLLVGTVFSRNFFEECQDRYAVDGFGECGEFHTLARVWETERSVALGLQSSNR